jgi:hypothetical protein
MSGTLALTPGQVFTGGASPSAGDAGTIALTQAGTVTFNTASPPTISDVTITQDAAASSLAIDGGVIIESVTLDSVMPDSVLTLTTNDLPPNITLPSGFSLPQTVEGTLFGVTVATDLGSFSGTAALYGTDGSLALVAVQSVVVDGSVLPISGGTAIVSSGVQPIGAVNETFAPAFTTSCYRAGTRVRTERGQMRVDDLCVGDRVVLARGGTAPVIWLGHRRVDCRHHPKPHDVWPVRVAAGAFGANQPRRDLFLSPDHAVFFGGVLIPIRYLVNDATIVQEPVDAVTYWHVELARHDIVLAEGLPCESYLDTGNRGAFANGDGPAMLHPDFALGVWERQGCAKLVRGGAELEAIRNVLCECAAALGHMRTRDPGLHVVANGRVVRPETAGRVHRFRLGRMASAVRLVSLSAVPAAVHADSSDHRRLGVAVSRIVLDGRAIPLADARLGAGWHAFEADGAGGGWRWTDGDAALDVPGAGVLEVEVVMTERYWLNGKHADARAA